MNPFPKQPPQSTSFPTYPTFPSTTSTPLTPQLQHQQLLQLLQSNPQLLQKYQQQFSKHQQMMKNKGNVSRTPLTSEEYLRRLGKGAGEAEGQGDGKEGKEGKGEGIDGLLDQEGGIVIEPSAGFVMKYIQKRSGQKIFINVVTHQIIDMPQQKLLIDAQNQPGLRIPMSMGRIKEDHDKNGNICKVIDVVLNPKIVQTAENTGEIFIFLGQIIGNYLLEKYKIGVKEDDGFRKVKGVKYKGAKVEYQRVKGKKSPKIEQLSQDQNRAQPLPDPTPIPQKLLTPQFQILAINPPSPTSPSSPSLPSSQPYSIDTTQYLYLKITINLPHLIHSKGIYLEGNQRMLCLVVKNLYQLGLKMPYQVGRWEAGFGRKERKLVVKAWRKEKEGEKDGGSLGSGESKGKVGGGDGKEGVQVSEKPLQSTKISVNIDNDLLYDLV